MLKTTRASLRGSAEATACGAAPRAVVKRRSLETLLQQPKKRARAVTAGHAAATHGERWPPQSHGTLRKAPRWPWFGTRRSRDFLARPSSQEDARAANRPPSPAQVPRGSNATTDTMVRDLLHPSASEEKRKHKLKRLVQSPNSFFMDVKCPGCFNITTVFSHAQTTVLCGSCSMMLCQPTGGKARLTEGCSFRKKLD